MPGEPGSAERRCANLVCGRCQERHLGAPQPSCLSVWLLGYHPGVFRPSLSGQGSTSSSSLEGVLAPQDQPAVSTAPPAHSARCEARAGTHFSNGKGGRPCSSCVGQGSCSGPQRPPSYLVLSRRSAWGRTFQVLLPIRAFSAPASQLLFQPVMGPAGWCSPSSRWRNNGEDREAAGAEGQRTLPSWGSVYLLTPTLKGTAQQTPTCSRQPMSRTEW